MMRSSIQGIFYLFDDNIIKKIEAGNIKDIAKELASLRGRAAHGSMSKFTEKQTQMIRLLEILVHAQMLRRAGLIIKKSS